MLWNRQPTPKHNSPASLIPATRHFLRAPSPGSLEEVCPEMRPQRPVAIASSSDQAAGVTVRSVEESAARASRQSSSALVALSRPTPEV